MIIRHDDGYESIYFHLEADSVPISVGDYVEAGTYLGMTGLSGWTTGEHLHFAVRNPNTKSSVPFLFDGTPVPGNQPIQTPNSSEVWLADFDGWTMATIGANIRSGPGTNYQDLDTLPYGTPLEFDAWTYGEKITEFGVSDARWYRIKGTNDWISSAIVNGNPPGSTPLPSNDLNSSNGLTVGGDFYTVWQQYLGTLGNPISGVSSHSSGASYQLFDNGSIVNSQYGTFPLYGAIRQTYLDTGGLNGWLGEPTNSEVGQGNGVIKQTFENGYIIWNGSRATAYQTGAGTPSQTSPPSNPTATSPLDYAELRRIDGSADIANRTTWVVTHGWKNSPSTPNIARLAQGIDGYQEGDQVLTLDWSKAADTWLVGGAASWIKTSASFAAKQLDEWGISPKNINVVGHSLGAYVSYEIAKYFANEEGIAKLIALDPAAELPGGYETQNINFSDNSDWAWAFYGSAAGSPDRAKTAEESFEIDFGWKGPWDTHGAVVDLFTNMLKKNYPESQPGGVSKFFGLNQMNSTGKPWKIDDGFEGKIKAKTNGDWSTVIPDYMEYDDGSWWWWGPKISE